MRAYGQLLGYLARDVAITSLQLIGLACLHATIALDQRGETRRRIDR